MALNAMDCFDYLLTTWDYIVVLWAYLPWIAYSLAFLTLIPKSWRRIISAADAELKATKFHRCYGVERCCHPTEENDEVVRPRKKVLRRFAVKREVTEHKSPPTTVYSPPPNQQTHVNQIAKMFEGNARKVNRVTPIITNDQNLDSSHLPEPKKTQKTSDDTKLEKRWHKTLDERFFKPSPRSLPPVTNKAIHILENDENSANLLNQCFETSAIVEVQKRQPSASPSPPPQPISRSTSVKASIENIFALATQFTKDNYSPSEPITSIDEILSQRRLSRPLSAYSISDLLGDNVPDDSYIDSVFGKLTN